MKISISTFLLSSIGLCNAASKFIKIRSSGKCEYIPSTSISYWPSWTYQNGELLQTENNDEEGWVNPITLDDLYLPADLPLPKCRPSLGIGITNGQLRYLMPSVVLTLETPDRVWRNRGIQSLPRADAWIDLYTSFSVEYIKRLNMAIYGKVINDVRFLEDIDGNTAWVDIAAVSGDQIFSTYEKFVNKFNNDPAFDQLRYV